MRGLIRTSTILAVLIAIGIVVSIIITGNITNRVTTAIERGFEEGRVQGYQDGFQKGSGVGYQEGSKTGYVKSNREDYDSSYGDGFYFVYNPTYEEVREILVESKMSRANEINYYVEAKGIRAAYIRCQIAREAAEGMVYVYELVAFETVDKGMVIIEPWSYKAIKVEVGRGYSELNGFPTPSYDDTITKITIVW